MNENEKIENPNAFPTMEHGFDRVGSPIVSTYEGMTLRDYFANSAMQSLIIKTTERKTGIWSKILIYFGRNGWASNYELSEKNISISAYEIADAMLKQRSQK